MLYDQKEHEALSEELFRAPDAQYRDTPFWAWNTRLTTERLFRQIDIMREMGMGGFHMHVRTGMDSPYLDEEFMGFIRGCTAYAKENGMLAWLYDEDRWPSGTAGGAVTAENRAYAEKALLFTTEPYTPERPHRAKGSEAGRGQKSFRQDNGELLAVYDVLLHADGTLADYARLDLPEELFASCGGDRRAEAELDLRTQEILAGIPAKRDGCVRWYAYVEYASDDPWFNDHPYVDTMDPEAIRRFLAITHETYAKAVGEEFGKTIPAIFTDEPQTAYKGQLGFAFDRTDVRLSWTCRLLAVYREKYGEDLLDSLPELFWELPEDGVSPARYRYHDLVASLFADAYCRQIGEWCDAHGIALTGHLMGEARLYEQTHYFGDAMRAYPYFGIPGIDMLCDRREFTTAKQTQSVVRQTGKCGMLSELYGVTGWDYDFRGYKLQGDWQAALGVTVRVPHLAWMSMKGESKRDYPASISYQSPWWKEYSAVADHFARLNTALTRGQAIARVAVIHPIESYWLYWGPQEQTAAVRAGLEESFLSLCRTLLEGKIDFDYICEETLPAFCAEGTNPLRVGEMCYDAVIVCGNVTLRSSTLARLAKFRDEGGRLIFIGDPPAYVDVKRSDMPRILADRSVRIQKDPVSILRSLEDFRLADVRCADGSRDDLIICQLRQDGSRRWAFFANSRNPVSPDVDTLGERRFILQGGYRLTEYDTLTGEIRPLPCAVVNGRTVFTRTWHIHDSLLLLMEALPDGEKADTAAAGNGGEQIHDTALLSGGPADICLDMVPVTLEEPNMLLLDIAEYSVNGGPWYAEEEVLRIDNIVREKIGIPHRRKEVCQPYLVQDVPAKDRLRLRFTFDSEITVEGASLALEDARETAIWLNGERVDTSPCGWYVDEDIETIPLPAIRAGRNVLEAEVKVGPRTNLEAMYLLGDFGVRVNGIRKTVTAPVRALGFGDIVPQGLPFYTGNIQYHLRVKGSGECVLRASQYRGGLLEVLLDGESAGRIIYSPYRLRIGLDGEGEHDLVIRLFGTRYNGFAQLHHTQGVYYYQSPNSWRSGGDLWDYEYQFRKAGILRSPELYGAAFIRPDGTIRTAAVTEDVHDLS